MRRFLLVGTIMCVLFAALLVSSGTANAQSDTSQQQTMRAASGGCSWPRCLILLNRSETAEIANSGPGLLIAIVGRMGWMGPILAPTAAILVITY